MHPAKQLRTAVGAALNLAAIAVDIEGISVPVTIFERPPSGGAISESKLPGLYCFVRSERISPDTRHTRKREFLLDIVLQAKGMDDEPIDQVDDMQLAVEIAIEADPTLGGIALKIEPAGAEINIERGEVMFAARRITFEAVMLTDRANPASAS